MSTKLRLSLSLSLSLSRLQVSPLLRPNVLYLEMEGSKQQQQLYPISMHGLLFTTIFAAFALCCCCCITKSLQSASSSLTSSYI